jgi:SAM-dependent methyltransferase
MKILEIGPSYSPIAPRSVGWDSRSLDHATQSELREKYRGQQNIDRIEPVDYVWRGGPLESAVPKDEHATFDVVIASHVLEHMPDPLGFFQSVAILLKPEGLLSIALPDKRRCFDFFRPLTTTANYLAAHAERRTRHSAAILFEYSAYSVSESDFITWDARLVGDFNLFHSVASAYKYMQVAQRPDESQPYEDCHATTYTPSSFALIVLELGAIQLMPFRIERSYPTAGCEFFITLRRSDPPQIQNSELNFERLRLMKATIRELAEQAHWLGD